MCLCLPRTPPPLTLTLTHTPQAYMGGVDRFDYDISVMSCVFRTGQWCRRLNLHEVTKAFATTFKMLRERMKERNIEEKIKDIKRKFKEENEGMKTYKQRLERRLREELGRDYFLKDIVEDSRGW